MKEDIKILFKQMTLGCGNSSCQNKESCIKANPLVKGKDNTDTLQKALRKVMDGQYTLCLK